MEGQGRGIVFICVGNDRGGLFLAGKFNGQGEEARADTLTSVLGCNSHPPVQPLIVFFTGLEMDKSYDFFVVLGDKNHVPAGIHSGKSLQAGNSPAPGAVKNCCLESCQLLNFYRGWILQPPAGKWSGQN